MCHQNFQTYDSVPTVDTQEHLNTFIFKSNLLVTASLDNISKKTSNPTRVNDLLKKYMGMQRGSLQGTTITSGTTITWIGHCTAQRSRERRQSRSAKPHYDNTESA